MIAVYALTDPDLRLPEGLRGVERTAVAAVRAGRVGAVVDHREAAPSPEPRHLWAHEAVVEALSPLGAVLPVRFGTVLEGVPRLVELLDRNAATITSALDRIRGLVEVGVRIRLVDAEVAAGAPEPPEPAAGSLDEEGRGRAYLLARLEEAQRRRAADARLTVRAEPVHRALSGAARAATMRTTDRGDVACAYLVAPDEVGAVVDLARRLDDAEPDLRLLCTGPWPAHSFTPELDLSG